MGILDDAIRQHLDLKRRQGAEEDELQRLEDEAFGPPSRPGDPEFGEPAPGGEATAAVEAPSAPNGEPPTEESARIEPAESTIPVDEAGESAAAVSEPATEPPPGRQAEEETGESPAFYDRSEHDLASRTDEQMAPDSAEEPISKPHEVPVSSLDTVEHHFEGAMGETGEERVAEAEPGAVEDEAVDDEEGVELVEGEVEDEGEGDEDEDVLEETPEFLRDAPEDDELWFEQGEPKDFDF